MIFEVEKVVFTLKMTTDETDKNQTTARIRICETGVFVQRSKDNIKKVSFRFKMTTQDNFQDKFFGWRHIVRIIPGNGNDYCIGSSSCPPPEPSSIADPSSPSAPGGGEFLGRKFPVSSKINCFKVSLGKSSNSISNLKGSLATGSSSGS